tara:strand:+ start:333 stop:455 length:123 start_codon:yes stop_codon:yes gene_type:complete
MVIHNHIFDAYRLKKQKIKEAIAFLKSEGYMVHKVRNKTK